MLALQLAGTLPFTLLLFFPVLQSYMADAPDSAHAMRGASSNERGEHANLGIPQHGTSAGILNSAYNATPTVASCAQGNAEFARILTNFHARIVALEKKVAENDKLCTNIRNENASLKALLNSSTPTLFTKPVKLKAPKPFTKAFLREHVADSRYMDLHMEKILSYVIRPNVQFSLREGLMSFMEDPDAALTVDTYLLEHVEKEGSAPFNKMDFKSAFIRSFTGEVRPPEVIALHELMAGTVTQGSDPVPKYAERFYQRSRRLNGETQISLCIFFQSGLKPELRALCCMDRNNKRWECLSDLVDFAIAEEERLNVRDSSLPAPHFSNPNAPNLVRGGMKRVRFSEPTCTSDDPKPSSEVIVPLNNNDNVIMDSDSDVSNEKSDSDDSNEKSDSDLTSDDPPSSDLTYDDSLSSDPPSSDDAPAPTPDNDDAEQPRLAVIQHIPLKSKYRWSRACKHPKLD